MGVQRALSKRDQQNKPLAQNTLLELIPYATFILAEQNKEEATESDGKCWVERWLDSSNPKNGVDECYGSAEYLNALLLYSCEHSAAM